MEPGQVAGYGDSGRKRRRAQKDRLTPRRPGCARRRGNSQPASSSDFGTTAMKATDLRSARICKALGTLFLAAVAGTAYPQESIVLDPSTGNYIITYQGLDPDDNPKWQQVTYVPPTKVNPDIRSWFRSSDNAIISYAYRLRSQRDSKQNLDGFDFRVSAVDTTSQRTPNGWWGFVTPAVDDAGRENGFVVAWSIDSKDPNAGLHPGRSVPGFGFASSHIPGVGIARITGATRGLEFPDEGPGDNNPVYPEFKKILANDHVARKVAIPLIHVPSPFDATLVLTDIQKNIDNSLINMALID